MENPNGISLNDKALVAEFIYQSYRFQRENSPSISPERWSLLFSGQSDLEERYQCERISESMIDYWKCQDASLERN